MPAPFHEINWYAGWWSILLAFVTGAVIGLGFHKREFMGGYDSFRRRIIRLGHIALAALGMMNVVYSLSPWPVPGTREAVIASWAMIIGNASMPSVCFLAGWKPAFRHLFFIPVASLVTAVITILRGGH
jgi:uncharacterized membrane protein